MSITICSNCFFKTPDSCQDAVNMIPTLTSGLYNITSNNVLTWCEFVDGLEGWALILKVNGALTTFSYNAAIWSSNNSLNHPAAVRLGLDSTEYKSPLYSTLPFTHVRVGFTGTRTNFVRTFGSFAYSASSLFSVIADGAFRSINFGRNSWKTIVGGGSLQSFCNRSGFNPKCDGCDGAARIGILGNNGDSCNDTDSRIGIGTAGTWCGQDATNSAGNEARCGGDNGDFSYKAFAYVMVR
jgi:hypothetical protein